MQTSNTLGQQQGSAQPKPQPHLFPWEMQNLKVSCSWSAGVKGKGSCMPLFPCSYISLSYRKQESELPYLSYLLWWHEEPQARQEGPWWQLPLCGDKELWPGKEKKDFRQRMNCADRWKQWPPELQFLHLDGLLLQVPAVNHSLPPVLDPPNTSGLRGEPCTPGQAREECVPA